MHGNPDRLQLLNSSSSQVGQHPHCSCLMSSETHVPRVFLQEAKEWDRWHAHRQGKIDALLSKSSFTDQDRGPEWDVVQATFDMSMRRLHANIQRSGEPERWLRLQNIQLPVCCGIVVCLLCAWYTSCAVLGCRASCACCRCLRVTTLSMERGHGRAHMFSDTEARFNACQVLVPPPLRVNLWHHNDLNLPSASPKCENACYAIRSVQDGSRSACVRSQNQPSRHMLGPPDVGSARSMINAATRDSGNHFFSSRVMM
eukprot:260142-Rhodomonas_salina.4